jgi:hypothetical protein
LKKKNKGDATMKTLMKQGVVLAAVLLVATILVTGCMPEPSVYTPSDGMGSVLLKFNKTIARATILPDDADIDTFAQFELTIIPSITGVNGLYTLAELADPIRLPPDNYTVTVIGYLDSGANPSQPAATTTAAVSFTVYAPPTTTPAVDVTLKAFDPANHTGNGTFVWRITSGVTALTAATMNVTPITFVNATATPSYGSFDLTDDTPPNAWINNVGLTVVAGYYYVDFSLTAGTPSVTRTFRHVLQIYRNRTSTFVYVFDDEKLGIVSAGVTFDLEYNHPEDNPPELVAAGLVDDTITLDSEETPPDSVTITVDNDTDYATFSWYYAAANGGVGGVVGTASSLLVDTNSTPFNIKGKYQLIVTGFVTATKAAELYTYVGAPFYSELFIEVK